jgi:hypothetical protein
VARYKAGIADTTRRPLGPAVYELMDAVARGVSVVEIAWIARTWECVALRGKLPLRW